MLCNTTLPTLFVSCDHSGSVEGPTLVAMVYGNGLRRLGSHQRKHQRCTQNSGIHIILDRCSVYWQSIRTAP